MAGQHHKPQDHSGRGHGSQGKPHHKKKRFGASVGITKFAAAGSKQWDKREKLEKERALNAAKVNAYKKLKKKLGDQIEPKVKLPQVLDDDAEGQQQQQQQQQQQPAALQEQQQEPVPAAAHQQDQDEQQQQQQHGRPHGGRPQGHGGRGGRGRGEGGRGGRGGRGGGRHNKPPSHIQRIAADVQAKKEAEQREREERRAAAEARAAKLAADAKQRAQRSKTLLKKTGHGQPVMKYRVEAMLAQLQQGGAR